MRATLRGETTDLLRRKHKKSDAMTLTTPALLFPAISLLLLAYTNRFLVLAQLIRQLHNQDRNRLSSQITRQIENLQLRIQLIRSMQAFGILSFIACTISMFSVFLDHITAGEWVFGISLILLVISLALSFWEIQISCVAINIELEDLRSGATGSDKALTEA